MPEGSVATPSTPNMVVLVAVCSFITARAGVACRCKGEAKPISKTCSEPTVVDVQTQGKREHGRQPCSRVRKTRTAGCRVMSAESSAALISVEKDCFEPEGTVSLLNHLGLSSLLTEPGGFGRNIEGAPNPDQLQKYNLNTGIIHLLAELFRVVRLKFAFG